MSSGTEADRLAAMESSDPAETADEAGHPGLLRSSPVRGVVLAGAYLISAAISLQFSLVGDVVTPVWPPAGIAVVGLMVWGRRYWPWITLAALAVNLPRTPTVLAAVGIAAGNTLAPLLATYLLNRFRFDRRFRRMTDAVTLVLAGALGSMSVSATVGTWSLLQAGWITNDDFAGTWSVWWAGDALGVLVFVPLLLCVRADLKPLAGKPARWLEAALLFGSLGVLASLTLPLHFPARYLLFPLLIWAALRFGITGAALATLVVSTFAVRAAIAASGDAGFMLAEEMLILQAFNVTVAMTSFVLAAAVVIRHRDAAEFRTRAEAEQLASRQSLEDRERQLKEAEALAHVGSWSWDLVTDTIHWSDELYRIFGLEPGEAPFTYRQVLSMVHPSDREQLDTKVKQALETGSSYLIEHRLIRPDGSLRWVRSQGTVAAGPDGPLRLVGSAQDVTEAKLAESLLRESEERYRGLVEQAPEAILVMDADSQVYVEANRAGEHLLGRSRAELMGVGLLETSPAIQPDGRASATVAADLIERALTGESQQFEWLYLHSSGRPVLCEGRLFYLPSAERRLVRASLMDVTERRKLDRILREAEKKEEELRQQQHIAQTLQRSLLPQTMFQPAGVSMAVRYSPGSAGLEVGGDWYDAFRLHDGSLGLVVGDVVGRGLTAAAAMGQLRTALRAYALHESSPRTVVEHLSRLAEDLPGADMATLVYAVYHPETGILAYSCAGHPPPLLINSDGESHFLDEGRSPPLGIPEIATDEAAVALEPGSILMLFTDGLIERRATGIDEGLAELAEAAAAAAGSGDELERIASRVISAMEGEELEDDVALLAMQVNPVWKDSLHFRGLAVPARLTPLRHAVTQWLRGAGAGAEEVQDLVLAVTEAVSNTMIHAYVPGEGDFEVEARKSDSRVEFAVRDFGTWRSRQSNVGGKGLRLMPALVHEIKVNSTERGTEVILIRELGRALPDTQPELEMPGPPDPRGRVDSHHLVAVADSAAFDPSIANPVDPLLRRLSNEHLGLVLDLQRLEHLDGTGVRALFQIKRHLDRQRIKFRVVLEEGSPVHAVLTLAEVGTALLISYSVEEAIDAILEE